MNKTSTRVLAIIMLLGAIAATVVIGGRTQRAKVAKQSATYRTALAKAAQKPEATTTKTIATKGSGKTTDKATALKKIGAGKTLKVAVMGDDIAAGHYTTKQSGAFEYQVQNYLQSTLGYKVTLNVTSSTGATVGGNGIGNAPTVEQTSPDLVIVEYGTNDQNQSNEYYAGTSTFATNLNSLLSDLQSKLPRAKVVVLTSWKADTADAYDLMIDKAAVANGATLVDIKGVWANTTATSAKATDTSWAGTPTANWPNDSGNTEIANSIIKQAITKFYVPKKLQ